MINLMAQEFNNIKMVLNMKETLFMELNKVKDVSIHGKI